MSKMKVDIKTGTHLYINESLTTSNDVYIGEHKITNVEDFFKVAEENERLKKKLGQEKLLHSLDNKTEEMYRAKCAELVKENEKFKKEIQSWKETWTDNNNKIEELEKQIESIETTVMWKKLDKLVKEREEVTDWLKNKLYKEDANEVAEIILNILEGNNE